MSTPILTTRFWQGRRVFMTGHTGFKGSWLSAWLLDMGAELRGFALAPVADGLPEGYQSFFDEMQLASRMEHQVGDIRDGAALKAAIHAFQPEIIIHMAAQPLVRLSYVEPVETYATNVMGTVHLLEACRNLASLRSVVVVSSDKCYENREQIWGYRETDAMGGHDPYSNSKGCTELVTSSYRNSFFPVDRLDDHGVVITSGRAGNVIGGGDWSVDRLIPDAMRALIAEEMLTIRKPDAVRPWQHVLEPLSGYLRLAEHAYSSPELCAKGWNFGPSDDMNLRVADVIGGLADDIGDRFQWQVITSDADPHEATLLKLDCTAARQHLHWYPQFNASDMLTMTANWYKATSPEQRRSIVAEQISVMSNRVCAA
ncbi:CDP-glucose 4,6-dehydratase [Epibacterium sp. SM1979]|uniref:CDP-glucose 4,6-dehydratase n=1 Tax=Tritonibacter litoralis TaxID=2662264 RepID=A0A843YFD3_9RHOB|nr:CDP-glucose 4,6-dehydratase [Tritonibacter litoralis]MQQ09601.1 CDP-glucose 4,6-dehydratase [Tritonibacter litoralis]